MVLVRKLGAHLFLVPETSQGLPRRWHTDC